MKSKEGTDEWKPEAHGGTRTGGDERNEEEEARGRQREKDGKRRHARLEGPSMEHVDREKVEGVQAAKEALTPRRKDRDRDEAGSREGARGLRLFF